MTRRKKLLLNSTTSLLYQVITLVCGFILPRVFLSTYGSTVNGLVSSISQFLGFISLCELGVGAVVQSALYKPLADGDAVSISKIAKSSERFFRKVAYILLIYTTILMALYPLKTIDSFDYQYTALLILIMSLSTFSQYYFGITYRLILTADQLGFVHFTVHSFTLILNTVACIVLMKAGSTIHIVKLMTSMIFLLQPVFISIVAKRIYILDKRIKYTDEPIKQKWNGLAQHIAYVVLNNTDTVVLTIFSTLENVSIYAVYNLVVNGVKQIILSMTNGIQSMMGNMLAKKEFKNLNTTFELFEWLIHTGVTLVFSVTAFLIVPFVRVYTKGITDVNYIVPEFAYMLVLATAVYCLRLPYNCMVLAAGHYKQTQWSAIMEAIINIVISIIGGVKFGLIGVASGTFVAMLYRTCYLAWYLKKNILNRSFSKYLLHLAVDVLIVCLVVLVHGLGEQFYSMSTVTYYALFILALKVGVTCVFIVMLINIICYRKLVLQEVSIITKRIREKKKMKNL